MPQRILVTGATSGLGRASALQLARRGHQVFGAARREPLLRTLEAEAPGTGLTGLTMDVTDPDAIAAARDRILEITDGYGVDAVVNNAGYAVGGPMELVEEESLRRQLDVNVVGLHAVTRAFLPRMRDRGRGRIVNISSVVGRLALPHLGAYCATKHAVEAISDALRIELAPLGIEVVIVEPGTTRTEFEDVLLDSYDAAIATGGDYASQLRRWVAVNRRAIGFGVSVDRVVPRIVKAVEAERPRRRYISLPDLLTVWAYEHAPAWLFDAIMRVVLGRS